MTLRIVAYSCRVFAAAVLAIAPCASAQPAATRTLDDFETSAPWRVLTSNQVTAAIRSVDGASGRALCLDYDFNGVSGYASLQRDVAIDYPDNYSFSFDVRGSAPRNDMQFKLIDASGDNVWWVNRQRFDVPAAWTQVVLRKRQISRAWGPAPDPTLRASRKLEFTVYNSVGGKGAVCFDNLTLRRLPADDASPLTATASSSADAAMAPAADAAGTSRSATAKTNTNTNTNSDTATGAAVQRRDSARFAVDGNPATAWRAGRGGALRLDLGKVREFGGLTLQWAAGAAPGDYRIAVSDDAHQWRALRRVQGSNGGRDDIALPDTEARYLRITLDAAPRAGAQLAEATLQALAYAATPNDFLRSVAKAQPRGRYPRGFSGEQPYWTILGLDGGTEQGLIGEDGAVEVGKSGFSIEPFLIDDGTLVTWADVTPVQSLQDGYLPIPSVAWAHGALSLRITAFAQGTPGQSQLIARYRVTNTGSTPRRALLALATRPMQVNPPTQFLSTVGGVSPIKRVAIAGDTISVDGRVRVRASRVPDAAFASQFDAGEVSQRLAETDWSALLAERAAGGAHAVGTQVSGAQVSGRVGAGTQGTGTHGIGTQGTVASAAHPARGAAANMDATADSGASEDPTALASGAMLYRLELAPGASADIALAIPMTGSPDTAQLDADALQREVAAMWRDTLDRVRFTVPPQGQALVDTLRTATAHMLISRIGPRLQPGTRSYARSWIRDGAMISEGLLRMGRPDVVQDYVRYYAPYQFKNGMVPCCVDDRGSDPVPENDSHGELIFNIAELYRYDGNRAFLETMWPHVLAAYQYMETLRLSERTEENRARNPGFYGLMPASISHEGYAAKPVHSYWDDFWALRGYKDAVEVARWLGHHDIAARMAASRDQFSADLHASIRITARNAQLGYIPGSVELADFDPTSTTIALAPGGEQTRLPQDLLLGGFERYWREFQTRADGTRQWKDYTPYEWRNVAAFIRLGWRERAWRATEFFFADRAPPAWNQWAEVVSRTPRVPFFVGDLPHAWVGSDFVRAALDMFAYARESDDSIVLAAGIPLDWLDGKGIAIDGLRTSAGPLSYRLRSEGSGAAAVWTLDVPAGLRLPPGGLVLPLPDALGARRAVSINGRTVRMEASREVRVVALPATVVVRAGR